MLRRAQMRRLVRLFNPALKIHAGKEYPILNPDEHLTEYTIKARTEPAREVVFVNQFGTQQWRLGDPVALLTPAEKQGHPFPAGLDHYKCYKALPPNVVDRPILVDDQFLPGPSRTRVREGRLFCVPVLKRHHDQVFPVLHPESHLAIYGIRPIDPPDFGIFIRDQFLRNGAVVPILRAIELAVESQKLDWREIPPAG
jgi:hypothetical protein